jgi:hypothetical protein
VTKIIASLYKYFCFKKLPTPYFRTIIFFSFIAILFYFFLYAIFPIPEKFNPFGMNKLPILNYVSGGLFFGAIYLGISIVFKKTDLEQYSFSETELKKSIRNIFLFFIFLFCLIMTLGVLQVRDKLWN